ncbi:LysR family transcriptional regulator OS=Streptomyces fumanus OX=67302 GN=GCM10018772_06230 PE=3 SV=1 [Streptomyces fumanus]
MLADLARRHPALDTRLTEVDPHLSVDLVAKGAVDLVVAHDWDIAPLPAPAGVEQAAIGDDLCDLLVPEGHPFAGRAAVRREELGGERWICQPPGRVCHDWLQRTLRAAGHEPDIVHQADENPTLVALVAAGLGVALIPGSDAGRCPPGWWRCRSTRCRYGTCTPCGARARPAAPAIAETCGRCAPTGRRRPPTHAPDTPGRPRPSACASLDWQKLPGYW